MRADEILTLARDPLGVAVNNLNRAAELAVELCERIGRVRQLVREYGEHDVPALTFDQLRAANVARLPLFKNAQGETAHAQPDGSDWTPADWMTAMVGEVGEAANIIKKIRRGDFARGSALEAAMEALRREFADVVIYLDILAHQFGIDLGAAVRDKFNEKSRQVGAEVTL